MPDYARAERLAWGRGAGNDFAKQNCKTWGMGDDATARYLCRRSFDPSIYDKDAVEALAYPSQQERQCSFDRTHKGMCVTKLWGNALPAHSQYWDAQTSVAGLSEQLDFCPVVAPDPSLSYYNASWMVGCRDPASGAGDPQTRFFEEFGEASRCFEANTLGDTAVFTACLLHKCTKDGALHLKVRDEVKECPPAGGKISFQQTGIAVDCTGYQHLCGLYESTTRPTLSVVAPLDSVVLATRDLDASLMISNYQAGQWLKIFVNGLHHRTEDLAARASEAPDRAFLSTVSLGTLPVSARLSQSSVTIK